VVASDAVDAARGGGFESLDEELTLAELPVQGEIPSWLEGTLVRTSPALLEIGGETIRHLFDGLAMLHAFSFSQGKVSYANRFLDTDSYRKARRGKIGYIGLGNDPCRAFFKRVSALFEPTVNDNANVNVARLGQRYLAMTETPLPVEFDPETLATKGLHRWRDDVGGHFFSAHPHYDFAAKELVSYVAHIGPRSSYRTFKVPDGSDVRQQIGEVKIARPAYIHSIGMSENYLIIAEFPLLINPLRLLAEPHRPLADQFRWRPERGTRWFVIDRRTGALRATLQSEAFWAFHHVNAFEEGGELVADIVVHENGPEFLRLLQVERLRGTAPLDEWDTRLHRFRLPLNGGAVRDERVSEKRIELPRINYAAVNQHPYRFVYAIGFRERSSDYYDELVKIDVEDRREWRWHEAGCYPGEGVFVAPPDAEREDDGALLSVVFDGRSGRSFLLVLDAATFEERGRASLPHHVPHGFHGDYFPPGDAL
jgi:carotenoid cleavage dioxygenase-like enzyme